MQVLIVDQHPSVHELLATLLREAFGDVLIYSERTLEGAISRTRRAEHVDLVMLDIALPGTSGIEALTTFRHKFPRCRVVVFSAKDDRGLILASLAARAAGFIPKDYGRKLAVAALRVVGAGGTYVPSAALPEQIRVPITPRQRDVLRLLLQGYSNERIAQELAISGSTVKQHTRAVFDALGVSTRAQLIATAARRGFHAENH
jgi:DNA-binding NarL/FixJ family response regulator